MMVTKNNRQKSFQQHIPTCTVHPSNSLDPKHMLLRPELGTACKCCRAWHRQKASGNFTAMVHWVVIEPPIPKIDENHSWIIIQNKGANKNSGI